MQSVRHPSERCIREGRRDQRHSEGQTIRGTETARHRDRAKIEKVDEVRVGAKQAVKPNRLRGQGLDFADLVLGGFAINVQAGDQDAAW